MAVSTSTGYYERLGVRRVVNGWGSSTILGGSTPAPGVVAAMEEANGAYVEMGDPRRAVEDLSRAISLNPSLPEAYHNRGAAYRD